MQNAYLNSIATAVPAHDIHQKFIDYASSLLSSKRDRALLQAIVKRSQIAHRYSIFKPHAQKNLIDADDFYALDKFPSTKNRMDLYKQHAFALACQALDQIDLRDITHLIITTCTGFYAPGIDLQIIQHYNLNPAIERTIVGFMGCCAAINALKLARHIVHSQKLAKVLVVNIELCTLHLQATHSLEEMLPFLIFSDGCAASIISAQEKGIELQSFCSTILPNSDDKITWHIGESGFDMVLSPAVPKIITAELPKYIKEIMRGKAIKDFRHFAIHPGGRAILDAIEKAMNLPEESLQFSREILRQFGNMSSASIMFVLQKIMQQKNQKGDGCAMAFGPGIAMETMLFRAL